MTAVDRFLTAAPSWDAFFRRAAALPASAPGLAPDKGKVFERLTQLYLQVHPEYRAKLRKVWRVRDELPPAVRRRIGLPRGDEGIDLVAETVGGELWAVQCKFRKETRKPLTVGELATFTNLTFNACRGISLALVAHTCARPVRKAALLGRTTEIGLDRWLALDAGEWRRILAATSRTPPRPAPREPRPHQRAAVAAAKRHFLRGRATRGRLVMPCGTGKSLTAFWIAEALKPRSILVAVPSLSLIKQSLADWTREFLARGEVPEWLCICGDESTGRLERDEFVGGVYELGVDATTDPEEIGRFLARRSGRRKVVFATYQSGRPLADAARARRFAFDLGIMDEAHRTVGAPGRAFGHLLLDRNLRVARRLFMTATERVVRGADEEVLSMDDAAVYGERFHQLTFKEAIAARPPIIADYRVLTITVSDERVRRLIEERRYLRTGDEQLGEREAQALAAGIALDRAFREEGVRHAISFHRSIRAAEEFRGQQERIGRGRRVGRPTCYHISSRKTAGERTDLLREFRERPSALITNARCLQEGVDIPAVDCVLFADPKQSVVDIVQAAGRAMRPNRGKKFGYIVVPIVVPSGMEFAQFAETTEFKQVARVVTALSTQDDRIAEEFRAVEAKGRRRGGERIVEVTGDVPLTMKVDLEKFREQVRLKLWERVGRVNWRPFERARQYAQSLMLKNMREWEVRYQAHDLPPDIPGKPRSVYVGQGWISAGDWLGTGTVAPSKKKFRSFQEAREYVRGMRLLNYKEWLASRSAHRLPPDIPSNPGVVYKNQGWSGYGDWLGSGTESNRNKSYRSFSRAINYVRSLKLDGINEWREYCRSKRKPKDIPASPWAVYRNRGWISIHDWLGSENRSSSNRSFKSFKNARAYVRALGLKNSNEWQALCSSGQLPQDIPTNPHRTYRDKGWAGIGDWLGTGFVSYKKRKWRPYPQARAFVHRLRLKSAKEWNMFSKSNRLPDDVPGAPQRIYRDSGWAGLGDWLGTGNIAPSLREYCPFLEARDYSRKLGLRSYKDWSKYYKTGSLRKDIPAKPDHVYLRQGWKGWGDWLGTDYVANRERKYRTYKHARRYVQRLRLTSVSQWRLFAKSGKLPLDIPSAADRIYAGKGWVNWKRWLGTE